MRITNGDLFVAQQHLRPKHLDKGKGLRYRRQDKSMVFTLCPRQESLKAVGVIDDPSVPMLLAESYSLSIAAARTSLKRGKNISIETDGENTFKYVCVGSAANRGGKGISSLHYVLKKMPDVHQERLRSHIVSVEQRLFLRFMETATIRQVTTAISKSGAPLFTTTSGASTTIYQQFAVGKNVYLSTHIDQDFTYSCVTIVASGDVDEVVAYFCFPAIGIVVPLRPFDVLFFDPKEPHNISSRCDNERDIFCISFYLKSNNIGGNNNDRVLTEEEKELLDQFKTHLSDN